MNRIKENEKKRNGLSVKWSDSEHRAVCDFAWKQRQTVSSLVREIVLEHLQKKGVKVETNV